MAITAVLPVQNGQHVSLKDDDMSADTSEEALLSQSQQKANEKLKTLIPLLKTHRDLLNKMKDAKKADAEKNPYLLAETDILMLIALLERILMQFEKKMAAHSIQLQKDQFGYAMKQLNNYVQSAFTSAHQMMVGGILSAVGGVTQVASQGVVEMGAFGGSGLTVGGGSAGAFVGGGFNIGASVENADAGKSQADANVHEKMTDEISRQYGVSSQKWVEQLNQLIQELAKLAESYNTIMASNAPKNG